MVNYFSTLLFCVRVSNCFIIGAQPAYHGCMQWILRAIAVTCLRLPRVGLVGIKHARQLGLGFNPPRVRIT
jgi:hypothetical protein